MHIECFQYFNEVAAFKSISKVANNSHISQSALSQQIQKLEDSLGYKLLERSNRGVELTDEGKIVEKYGENIIRTYNKMVEDLNNSYKSNGIIRIDSCYTIATYALPCTMYSIKEKYPHHNYKLTTNVSNDVEENILNDICDLGFIYGRPKDNSLEYYKVGIDRLMLVSSPKLNNPEEIKSEELIKYSIIMLADKLEIEGKLEKYLKTIGHSFKELNIMLDLDSIESVKSLVLNGNSMSFLPYISIKKELYTKQLKETKINGLDMKYEVYLINKKSVCKDNMIKEFIEYFKKIGKNSFC
ncbi:LysR family transcriptional regulator [Clostridium sp.]|uniref:LysR family transcriptional regulator n=1 Tax=Clostridium sp. TaxID=1506 RepID=UPI001A3C85BA|nr:LysR family transcriptional regulator [Clostridium sp.]MBK5234488.1 LysR family transcriptional regulator [Clostridium sp.]